jgi:nucleotide-binding universal stress UspA family protein
MRILVGVDDSPCSERAVDFVRKMKWPAGSRLLVLSVAHIPVPVTGDLYGGEQASVGVSAELERTTHQALAERVQTTFREAGLATETRVTLGDPRVDLVEIARAERADLIVVGSHGRTGIGKLLLGSVASHVVTHAPCSVLVVKQTPA